MNSQLEGADGVQWNQSSITRMILKEENVAWIVMLQQCTRQNVEYYEQKEQKQNQYTHLSQDKSTTDRKLSTVMKTGLRLSRSLQVHWTLENQKNINASTKFFTKSRAGIMRLEESLKCALKFNCEVDEIIELSDLLGRLPHINSTKTTFDLWT